MQKDDGVVSSLRRTRAACALLAIGLAAGAAWASESRIHPVDLPPSRTLRALETDYIDDELTPAALQRDSVLDSITAGSREAIDLLYPMNNLYTELRRGLGQYRSRWSRLPQTKVPDGPLLREGAEGDRVALLRERLGLPAGQRFDKALAEAVRQYQAAHGLPVDGLAGAGTIASLNLGAEHYERIVQINLERVRALPAEPKGRYVLVDVPTAQLRVFENGKVLDTMRVIVGNREQETPMLAVNIRYAEVNPYWNIPLDMVKERVAPRVLSEGPSYLTARRYQVLSDFTDRAEVVDPGTVDWQAVADGKLDLRMRQLPGESNSMGAIKFMMPNRYGIYLHDTPNKALFEQPERWISNGCVRVEDARRLARWLFGAAPQDGTRDPDVRVDLAQPVPVFITYQTAAPSATGGISFRPDPYGHDARVLARMERSQEDAGETIAGLAAETGASAN
jgi:murein L,D-transpeptidase YcbB/YkuD